MRGAIRDMRGAPEAGLPRRSLGEGGLNSMRLWSLVTLLTLALGGSQQPPPAAPVQTFRSGAQVVEVDVRVLGKDGKFVTDLALPDFELTEDGVPQKIQSITLIGANAAPLAPAPLAPSAPLAPAPLAPSAPLAPLAPVLPQTWLFVFDTAHLTAGPLQRTREAVEKFLGEKFREGDLGGVVVDGKMANNRLTRDREELRKAVAAARIPGELRGRQLEMREWPRLRDELEAFRIVRNERDAIQSAVSRACAEEPDQCKRVPPDVQVMSKARQMVTEYRAATLQSLAIVDTLCRGLARIPGPKTVVFFSEGFILEEQESQLRQAVGQAARAGAHFYTIDARGLNTGPGAGIIDQAHPDNPMGAPARFDMQADGTNSLAVDTGGFAIRNENNFGRALDEIQRDTGTYYVVGYTPVKDTFDGKYREISVKVTRPGVKVRARRGYLAIAPATLRPAAASAPAVSPKLVSDSSRAEADVSPKPATDGAASVAGVSETKAAGDSAEAKAGAAEAAVSPKSASAGAASVAGSGETKADIIPAEDSAKVAGSSSTSGVRPRIDAGKMVLELGRPASDEPSSALKSSAELGWAAYEKGDVETAARELAEAAKATDARPWVVYALGLSQFALRRYPEAAAAWERVRHDVPEFEPIYFSLADAYGLQHEEGTALKVLREAERRWPADAEIANAIGVIQIRRGALDAAIESFERATTIAPADSLGYFNLARTHQMRLLKSQRYDRQMQKWIGGDEDRRRAIAAFQKYLQLGGPYERQAREALAALSWS
jgi:VWFA-related protein